MEARLLLLFSPTSLNRPSSSSASTSFPVLDPTAVPILTSIVSEKKNGFGFGLDKLVCKCSSAADEVRGGEKAEAQEESPVEELRVPEAWLDPSSALQESEWLRVSLLKWLDDEYCPEPPNIEISKLAAKSYYESLAAKQVDLGQILLKMVRDLENMSFQESFHGPFSSANAAIDLIIQKINSKFS